jgi:hypothetical protein
MGTGQSYITAPLLSPLYDGQATYQNSAFARGSLINTM